MAAVDIGSRQLHVARRGSGDPLLLIPGLAATSGFWGEPFLDALAADREVITYDHRGIGESSPSQGAFSIADLADDAAALLEALALPPVHFAGLSMGGMVGQQLGARYPEKVRSLALCDTASEMPPRNLWEERLETARTQGVAGLVDGTIQRWFTAPFIARAPQDIAKVRAFILSTGAEGYIACASAVRDMAQSTMLLKIKAPTLVMTGRQDPACTVDQATVLHRVIAHSELLILEDAAHLANIEQPQAFNQALRRFIDSVEDGSK